MAQVTPTAEVVPSGYNRGRITTGQQFNEQGGYVVPFTEQVVPYYTKSGGDRITGFEGNTNCEITRIDEHSAMVRTYDGSFVDIILASLVITARTIIGRIELPDVLTGIVVTYNTATGSGTDDHPADQQTFTIFGSGSGALNPSSTAQGSASIIPEATPTIIAHSVTNRHATEYTFYMANGATFAQILARLTALAAASVLEWPNFKPQSIILTQNGQQASVSAKADTRVSGGGSTDSGQTGYEWGNGTSKETGVSVSSKTLPPTIHGTITITGDTATATASAAADASTDIFLMGTLAEQPAIDNTVSVSLDANASVTPSSIAATSPFEIPATGLYLYSLTAGPQIFGYISYQAIVVDFATI